MTQAVLEIHGSGKLRWLQFKDDEGYTRSINIGALQHFHDNVAWAIWADRMQKANETFVPASKLRGILSNMRCGSVTLEEAADYIEGLL